MKRKKLLSLVGCALCFSAISLTSCDIGSSECEHDYGELYPLVYPTCEENGHKAFYHCSKCDAYFNKDKVEVTKQSLVLESLSHSYGSPTYSWNGNTCVATIPCLRDANHSITETVEGEYVEDTPATCTSVSKGHYVATFTNLSFETQTTETNSAIGAPAKGHNYENPVYTWDNDKCTGTVTCKDDSSHVLTETVSGTVIIDDAEALTGHYLATFESSVFTQQTTPANSVDAAKSYSIHFVTNSDEILDEYSFKEKSNVSINSLPNLSDRDTEECRFVCWTFNGVEIKEDFKMPSEDLTFVAKWRALETWTIKFETGIDGVTMDDVVINEDQGLDSFVAPALRAPYRLLNGWYYDQSFVNPVGSSLDIARFTDHSVTLYAKSSESSIENTADWKFEDDAYVGKGFTQIKDISTAKGKQLSVDVEFPEFDKSSPYGETEIYFGGDEKLFTNNVCSSGYKLIIHGATATNNDDIGSIKAPRSGSFQLFKIKGSESLFAGRRYNPPFAGSSYNDAYNNYLNSSSNLTVNFTFTFGETKTYIDVMNTRMVEFDYTPDGDSFGIHTNNINGETKWASFRNIISRDVPNTKVNLSIGNGATISTTSVDVPFGSTLGDLPIPTKPNATFLGWTLNGKAISSSYVPGTISEMTLEASWESLYNYVIKYDTGDSGIVLEDTKIAIEDIENDFVPRNIVQPYLKVEGWYYDSLLTEKVGAKLDTSKFDDYELTIYANIVDTDVQNTAMWSNDAGVYTGKGLTELNSVVASKGKQISVDVEFPAFNKGNPFGETEIFFGGDNPLNSTSGVKSGYFLVLHGANAANNDDVGGVKAPRSGSYQLFQMTSSGNVSLAAGRRYTNQFANSDYMRAYNDYIDSGTVSLTVNVKIILGENKSYIELMGTQLCEFDYTPTDGSFGIYTSNASGVCAWSKFKNLTCSDVSKTLVKLDGGVNSSVEPSTIEVPFGSTIGSLPTPTKQGFTFSCWKYNGQTVSSNFMPGRINEITLKAEYTESFVLWDGTTDNNIEGSGTKDNPYLIKNGGNLAFVTAKINSGDAIYNSAYYLLTSGIDLGGREINPIGASRQNCFKGYFDGDGHTIKNGVITDGASSGNYRALFGWLEDADLVNLNFNGQVSASNIICGGLVAGMNMSTIENCSFSGTVNGQQSKVGGIVGLISNPNSFTASKHTVSTINNCVNKGTITLTNSLASNNGVVGGVVGYADGKIGSAYDTAGNQKIIVKNCTNEGNVIGGTCTGGVVARVEDPVAATIIGCVNTGTISAEDYVGGIVGFLRQNSENSITNCYNYGDINSNTEHAGGVLGLNRGVVISCYCASNVKIRGTLVSANVLVGKNGAIIYSNDAAHGGSYSQCGLCSPLVI